VIGVPASSKQSDVIGYINKKYLIPCLAVGATYSQSGNTITVSSVGHGLTAALNGATAYLVPTTGALATGWYSDFLYITADTFSVTSTISQITSGSLLNITSGIFNILPAGIVLPANSANTNSILSCQISLSCAASSGSNRALRITINNDTSTTNCLLYTQFSAGSQANHNWPNAYIKSATRFRTTSWANLYNDSASPDQEVTAFDFRTALTINPAVSFSGSANDWICLENLYIRVETP